MIVEAIQLTRNDGEARRLESRIQAADWYPSVATACQQGDIESATHTLFHAIREGNCADQARVLLAGLFVDLGEPRRAEEVLLPIFAEKRFVAGALAVLAYARHEIGAGDAGKIYGQALLENPNDVSSWYRLGNWWLERTDAAKAESAFSAAIQRNRRLPEAHIQRAIARRQLQRDEAAEADFRAAVELSTDSLPARYNLAEFLRSVGRPREAKEIFESLFADFPSADVVSIGLILTLAELGEIEQAHAHFVRYLATKPATPAIKNTEAKLAHARGEPAVALEMYLQLLHTAPAHAELHNNIGTAMRDLQRFDESIDHYRKSVALDPNQLSAWNHLASSLADSDNISEHKTCCDRLAVLTKRPLLCRLRELAACPTVFESRESISNYRQRLHKGLLELADRGFTATPEELWHFQPFPSFNLPFHGEDDRPIKEAFARLFAPLFPSPKPARRSGKLKVGIVITHDHERPFLRSMRGMFPIWNPDSFDPVIFGSPAGIRRMKPQIEHPTATFVPLPTEPSALLETVAQACCDVLYFREVGTDATNYFLPFAKLAPIQINTYGIQVTSGNAALDYYVSSDLIETSDADPHYTENLVRLKTLLVYRDRLAKDSRPPATNRYRVSEKENIYLCAQQIGKFHPDFDSVLREILQRDEDGVILVSQGQIPVLAERLKHRFARTLGSLANRIRFVPPLVGDEYADLLASADVVLDPFYFGGMNTTYDPLSLGKIVVTLPSAYHRGRYTLGCYRAIGWQKSVALSIADYIEKAILIAKTEELRRTWEAELSDRAQQLFRWRTSAIELEEFFITSANNSRRGY